MSWICRAMPWWRTIVLALVCMGGLPAVRSATLAISCGAVGKELELCRSGAEAWAHTTGHRVRVVSTPSSSNERLALYQQLLAAGAGDIDVFQIDVVWPGILGAHFIDLQPYSGGAETWHLPALVENNRVDDRLVAMPWFVSAGLLYYRRDLLEKYGQDIPATWPALAVAARRIQDAERAAGNSRMWGFVWQGRAYEGLTCDALEWIAGHGGGTILDSSGAVTVDNDRAAAALAEAAGWVGDISPRGVLNYAEEDARGVFQSGNAVFMRNWPYAWNLSQSRDSPVRGRVGVAPLPRGAEGGKRASVLGGWQLAVSRYSAHPALAADLVMYLTSAREQKRRALEAGYPPTIPTLYQDAEILRANPFFTHLYPTLLDAVARPSSITGSDYNRVSSLFWNTVHGVLAGKRDPAVALQRLQRDLRRLRRRGGW